MKKIWDYIFPDLWQLPVAGIIPNEVYMVNFDLGDLKKGSLVKFVGFDDVDNHYGIFVFYNSEGSILEVSGDCSGPDSSCVRNLKSALSKPV